MSEVIPKELQEVLDLLSQTIEELKSEYEDNPYTQKELAYIAKQGTLPFAIECLIDKYDAM